MYRRREATAEKTVSPGSAYGAGRPRSLNSSSPTDRLNWDPATATDRPQQTPVTATNRPPQKLAPPPRYTPKHRETKKTGAGEQ